MKSREFRHLRRIDSTRHGWQVEVLRINLRVLKWFGDSTWGGKEQALHAAREWRDKQPWFEKTTVNLAYVNASFLRARKVPRRLEVPLNKGVAEAPPADARLVHVERCEHLGRGPDGEPRMAAFWMVSWTDTDGVPLLRKFPVDSLGEDSARQQAQALGQLQKRLALIPAGPYAQTIG